MARIDIQRQFWTDDVAGRAVREEKMWIGMESNLTTLFSCLYVTDCGHLVAEVYEILGTLCYVTSCFGLSLLNVLLCQFTTLRGHRGIKKEREIDIL